MDRNEINEYRLERLYVADLGTGYSACEIFKVKAEKQVNAAMISGNFICIDKFLGSGNGKVFCCALSEYDVLG